MTVAAGTRLGVYEVISLLGAGGMGEVYRAMDTKLRREVAIKVLPPKFVHDRERLARFEREARLLAALNHPNVAALYDLETWDETQFLVMELVSGVGLREKLHGEPLSVREALTIFHQIALGLEAAHQKGIVHRDLKPENVKITPENVVKVLDFGLAKAFEPEAAPGDPLEAPTGSFKSAAEVVLGTLAYMSPEQARGHTVDKRTDVWAFGCCLFEALGGHHPFARETASDIVAAVLSVEPDWDELPRNTPRGIKSLVRRCLRKDANHRLHDIADARIEIGEALALAGSSPYEVPLRRRWQRAIPWISTAVLAVALGGVLWRGGARGPASSPAVRRFSILLPPTAPLALGSAPALALSPDGTRLVYVGQRGDKSQLYLRTLEQVEPTAIPGTEAGSAPFFSPAGDWLGFFADGKLKKVPLMGGPPVVVAEGPTPRGAAWGAGDAIAMAPLATGGLQLLYGSGGAPKSISTLDGERPQKSHRWPMFLPGGKDLVITTWDGSRFDVELLRLETGARKLLIEDASDARYAPTGHLVFLRGTALFAAPFDLRRREVTGEPVQVLDAVRADAPSGAAFFTFHADGMMVYVPAGSASEVNPGTARLFGVDRNGAAKALAEIRRAFQLPRLSPREGNRLLVTVSEGERTDLWVYDLARGTLSRLTYEGANAAGIWTPDEKRVTFSSDRGGVFNLYWQPADGGRAVERLVTSPRPQFPVSWSPDGQTLAVTEVHPSTGLDIWTLSLKGPRKLEPFLVTTFSESGAKFSPDGRFIAYVSNESGQDEVYVRGYPDGEKLQISDGGGTEPVWSKAGQELFYRNRDWLMTVSIETATQLAPGKPRFLLEAPYDAAGPGDANYDVTPDGRTFVVVQSEQESTTTELGVILNWFEYLTGRVPRRGAK